MCPILAGLVLFLADSSAAAQTAASGATAGGTGGGGGGGGGTGGGGGGGGGTGNSTATNASNVQSAFGSLSPSTGVGPTISIGGTSNTAFRGAGGAAISIPTTSNPFANYYYNPLQYGLPGSNGGASTGGGSISNAGSLQSTFGQPLYNLATTTTNQAAGGAGVGANANQNAGFTTLGRSRAPTYYAALSPDFPIQPRSQAKVQSDLQQVLQRTFTSRPIQVFIADGGRVILRGSVASERDRERAEDQARITPGVEDVVNELRITAPGPAFGAAGGQTGILQSASK